MQPWPGRGHIGDTPVYLFPRGCLTYQTRNRNLVQELINAATKLLT